MSALNNAKHEHFAQLVAKGEAIDKAYVLAGYSEKGASPSGQRLLRDARVKARVEELRIAVQERTIERAAVDRVWVLEQLKTNLKRAMQAEPVLDSKGSPTGEYTYEGSVANRALELIGKELGMFVERKRVGPLNIEDLTDDELAQLVEQLEQKQAPAISQQELERRRTEASRYDWAKIARPNQLAPEGIWNTWLILAGRGFGKTRTGAEWIRQRVESGTSKRIALIAPTAADAREVMVEGESGILSISPNRFRPIYEPSKRRLTWPNGAMATTYSADEPDRLRGPQHDAAWCDEIAAWKYPESWDMLLFGLRLGKHPQAVVTTTPRPTKIVKELAADKNTVITRGSTFENKANLAPAFIEQITKKYEGTRLGRQELNAEILDDNPNALWQRSRIDELRVREHPNLERVVIAIDPAVTSNEDDETGIVVAGLGVDGKGYILDDKSLIATPDAWARLAVRLYRDHKADRIIAETNNGGDMVEAVIRTVDRNVSYKKVTASRGKTIRAEPIAALYEQGRVHHVGYFPMLEDQMCDYDPVFSENSPDRMDALVWALTELALNDHVAAHRVTLPIMGR